MDNEKALEQKRVDDVMNEIQKQSDATQIEYDKAHKETTSVERNYVQNARVNMKLMIKWKQTPKFNNKRT